MEVFFVADASPTVNDSSVVVSLTGTYKMKNEKKVKKKVVVSVLYKFKIQDT